MANARALQPVATTAPSPYLQLRVALEQFGCLPEEVAAADQLRYCKTLERMAAIEQALVSHPLAANHKPDLAAVATALATLRGRFANDAEFSHTMRRNSLDEASLTKALRRELWSDAVLKALVDQQPALSTTDIALYYHLHRDELVQPELRLTRHLLITINPEIAGNRPAESRQRMLRLRQELLAHPHKFARLAARYSECPTALKEGMLGWVKRGLLYPTIDDALFGLNEGGLSLPLETEIGLHLVRCEQIRPARLLSLEQAQPAILKAHRERVKRRLVAALLA